MHHVTGGIPDPTQAAHDLGAGLGIAPGFGAVDLGSFLGAGSATR